MICNNAKKNKITPKENNKRKNKQKEKFCNNTNDDNMEQAIKDILKVIITDACIEKNIKSLIKIINSAGKKSISDAFKTIILALTDSKNKQTLQDLIGKGKVVESFSSISSMLNGAGKDAGDAIVLFILFILILLNKKKY